MKAEEVFLEKGALQSKLFCIRITQFIFFYIAILALFTMILCSILEISSWIPYAAITGGLSFPISILLLQVHSKYKEKLDVLDKKYPDITPEKGDIFF